MRRTANPSCPRSRRRGLGGVVLGVLAFALALSACGGSSNSADPTILPAGQLNIKLPQGFKVVAGKVVAPAGSATAAGAGSATATTETGTTVPVSGGQDSTTAMFSALAKFRKCLDDTGIKFIGAPDQSNPNSPTNDPNYIKGLSTCAARSNIVQAMKASQSANDNLTPAEIKVRNKGYLKWRSCMIGRGWKIPEPTPDAQGRLFVFSTTGSGAQITPPAGKDILSSPDVQQCAAQAQKVVGK